MNPTSAPEKGFGFSVVLSSLQFADTGAVATQIQSFEFKMHRNPSTVIVIPQRSGKDLCDTADDLVLRSSSGTCESWNESAHPIVADRAVRRTKAPVMALMWSKRLDLITRVRFVEKAVGSFLSPLLPFSLPFVSSPFLSPSPSHFPPFP